jgi:cell division septum initiation protein DivIVA
MALSEMPSDQSIGAGGDANVGAAAGQDEHGQQDDLEATGAREAPWPGAGRRFARGRLTSSERDRILAEARDITFPITVRGYRRADVARYVKDVNRLIAELEISSSPESAVRHALDEVSEETRDILQRAHQTAEEITARSRAKADDRLQQAEQEAREARETAQREAEESREAAASEAHQVREAAAREAQQARETAQREATALREAAAREAAELTETTSRETGHVRAVAERETDELRARTRREADELLEAAEHRTRELTQDAEAIWRERRRLIDDIAAAAGQLLAISETASTRFARFGDQVAALPAAANPSDATGEITSDSQGSRSEGS